MKFLFRKSLREYKLEVMKNGWNKHPGNQLLYYSTCISQNIQFNLEIKRCNVQLGSIWELSLTIRMVIDKMANPGIPLDYNLTGPHEFNSQTDDNGN